MKKPWVHHLLASTNLALVIVSVLSQKGHSAFLGELAFPASKYLFPLLSFVYHDSSFERRGAFYFSSFLLATIIFLLVIALRRLSPLRLRSLSEVSAGMVSATAYPLGCLWTRWAWHRQSAAKISLLLLETMAAAAYVIIYFLRTWPASRLFGLSVLAGHFILWAWACRATAAFLELSQMYTPWRT
jgi:hypothetical protein